MGPLEVDNPITTQEDGSKMWAFFFVESIWALNDKILGFMFSVRCL